MPTRKASRLVSLVCVSLWVSSAHGRDATTVDARTGRDDSVRLRAGAAQVDVSPPRLPVRVNGGFTQRIATKVLDRLHARCLVLDRGRERIAIVVVDSCLLPRDLLDRVKSRAAAKSSILASRMLISATHTHTAPAVAGAHGTDVEPGYRRFLEDRLVDVVCRAEANLTPARAGWAVGELEEFIFCRRWIMKPSTAKTVPFTGREEDRAQMNPGHGNSNKVRQTGPVDPSVTVLSVETADGKPLALLANYSTHYAGSSEVSADYFGEFARIMTRKLEPESAQPPFVAMMSNGTSGDANSIDFSRPSRRKFTHTDVAEAAAAEALRVLKEIRYQTEPALGMVERKIRLAVRMPTEEEVVAAREYLEVNVKDRPVRTVTENYARETVLLSELPPTRELKLQAIRLGGFAIAAIPCEVYGSTGLEIKKGSPFGTGMIISLANGCEGYIPPEEQFPLGGYTTWRARTSCLEVGAERKIRETILDLLRELAGTRREE